MYYIMCYMMSNLTALWSKDISYNPFFAIFIMKRLPLVLPLLLILSVSL